MIGCQYELKTGLGSIYLIASERGLSGLCWERKDFPGVAMVNGLLSGNPAHRHIFEASRQLKRYLDGESRGFDLALDLTGTAFQESVWKVLRSIPFGATFSYRQVAERIGHSKAVRAVGAAIGRNPICIIIPCHRVVASDGSMGGYAGGLPLKRRLLALEGPAIP